MLSLRRFHVLITLAFVACAVFAPVSQAAGPGVDEKARQVWQLLDYVAVDYGGAVLSAPISS